jgi:hypothetical protein
MRTAISQVQPAATPETGRRKVGVIGAGAIGASVIEVLARGGVDGAELACMVDVHPVSGLDVPQVGIADAIRLCDVIVECAGQVVVGQYAVRILEAGVDLLVSSVGAFADEALLDQVLAAGAAGPRRGHDAQAARRPAAAVDGRGHPGPDPDHDRPGRDVSRIGSRRRPLLPALAERGRDRGLRRR